ncbi:MAG: signal peptidase I [candidate division SR1 bacterium]|nr:signal peptidase I [candidate division SR1 bacterium]
MPSGLIFEEHRHSKDIKSKMHPSLRREAFEYLFYFLKVFICVTLVFVVLKTNVYQVTSIEGRSMYPTYDNSDILFIDIFTPKFGDYRRGDIVIIQPPADYASANKNFIKRIIGLPDETIGLKDGIVVVYNKDYSRGVTLNEKDYLEKSVKSYLPSGGNDEYKFRKLGKDEYFLMGDNRGGSTDSRKFGPIKKSEIVGRALYQSSPSSKAGGFKLPTYNINN